MSQQNLHILSLRPILANFSSSNANILAIFGTKWCKHVLNWYLERHLTGAHGLSVKGILGEAVNRPFYEISTCHKTQLEKAIMPKF